MLTLTNEVLAIRYHSAIFNQNDYSVADEILAPDFVMRSPGLPPELSVGPEGIKAFARLARSAFPNYVIKNEDIFSAGNKVVARWSVTGTHRGEFMGIRPTGKMVSFSGIHIFRVADGKLAEGWEYWDQYGLMKQLGMVKETGFSQGGHITR